MAHPSSWVARIRGTERRTDRHWGWADLRRPAIASTAVVAFVLTLPLAVVGSCNVHEFGHAVAGSAVGWEVDRVVPCLPSGGYVQYRASNAAGDAVESWAGGLAGALSLLLIYSLISRRGRPLRSPIVWACGLGLTVPIGIQLVIATLEGTAEFGDDYTDTIAARPGLFLPILLLSALAGPAMHTWWWVRRRTRGR
ncbi:MAG: hypothetical protein ACSLE3_08130 [Microbacteriaceae bacterium]